MQVRSLFNGDGISQIVNANIKTRYRWIECPHRSGNGLQRVGVTHMQAMLFGSEGPAVLMLLDGKTDHCFSSRLGGALYILPSPSMKPST
ncbi:hypothetical protein [Rhizobium phage RHEph12]|nr:hypothetical protein [Rhizobium phage RHEph12]